MGWTKLKLTLAAVLLASNLVLLFCVISLYRSTEYLPEDSLAAISRLLEEESIYLGEEVLTGEKPNLLIYEGVLGDDYYTRVAEALSTSSRRLSFNTPSGYVMTMENGDRVSFQNGFGIRYVSGGAPTISFQTPEQQSLVELNASETRELRRIVSSFLEGAQQSSGDVQSLSLSFQILFCGDDPLTGLRYCVCAQNARHTPVVNLISTFAVKNGEIVGMVGEWCFARTDASYSAQLMDQINILYTVKDRIQEKRTDSRTPVTVCSLTLGYTSYLRGDTDQFYLIPAWSLELQDGKTYVINALDGAEYTK